MLSFLQPILSYSQGGGEGTFICVPQTTAQHLQLLAGQHWQEWENPRGKISPPLGSKHNQLPGPGNPSQQVSAFPTCTPNA